MLIDFYLNFTWVKFCLFVMTIYSVHIVFMRIISFMEATIKLFEIVLISWIDLSVLFGWNCRWRWLSLKCFLRNLHIHTLWNLLIQHHLQLLMNQIFLWRFVFYQIWNLPKANQLYIFSAEFVRELTKNRGSFVCTPFSKITFAC